MPDAKGIGVVMLKAGDWIEVAVKKEKDPPRGDESWESYLFGGQTVRLTILRKRGEAVYVCWYGRGNDQSRNRFMTCSEFNALRKRASASGYDAFTAEAMQGQHIAWRSSAVIA